jgi:LysM repeat protein
MMRRLSPLRPPAFGGFKWPLLMLLLSVSWSAIAQEAIAVCEALIVQALDQVGDNCAGMERNTACYGYNLVESTFTEAVDASFFTRPADRTELTALETLRTTALNTDEGTWGIAVLSVQANIPNTLPGQAVTFVLIGDAQIENAVETALPDVPPVEIITATAADARSAPNLSAEVVSAVAPGTPLQADALSRESDWLRVVVNDTPVWIPRAAVTEVDGLDALPVITATTRTPMQAFYFTTGFAEPQCQEAPDSVTIYSPDNLVVDLTINGIDVRVGSVVSMRSMGQNQVAMTVQEGTMETADGQVVVGGQTILAATDRTGNVVDWQILRPLDGTEAAIGAITDQIVTTVGLDTGLETIVDGELIHIVAAGETLFGIARRYDASMPGIIARNTLNDPTSIFVGQELVIPNPGSGFVNLPISPEQIAAGVTPEPDILSVDCSTFRATSPTVGLAYGLNQFFWDPAAGATRYQVNVYNLEEDRRVSFPSNGALTTASGDLSQNAIGGGFSFAWEVQAFLNSQLICTTPRQVLPRAANGVDGPLIPVVPPPIPTASVACGPSAFQYTVTWSGFPATDTVTLTYSGFYSGTFTGLPPNGAQPIAGAFLLTGTLTGSPSGLSAAIPAVSGC